MSDGHVDAIDEKLLSAHHVDDDYFILQWAVINTIWC